MSQIPWGAYVSDTMGASGHLKKRVGPTLRGPSKIREISIRTCTRGKVREERRLFDLLTLSLFPNGKAAKAAKIAIF